MIPFGRMITYGNAAPPPTSTVKKFLSPQTTAANSSAFIVLYSTGELYGIGGGPSFNFIFGDGVINQNRTTWTLIRNNVKNVWCTQSTLIILQTFDDKFFFSGNRKYFMDGSGTTETYPTFTDCTTFFTNTLDSTTINSGIRDIQISQYTIFVILNNNDMYGCGYNFFGELGITNSAGLSALTLLHTNIEKCVLRGNSTWYMNTSKQLFRTGRNADGQLGTGTTTNVFTPVQYIPSTNYTVHDFGTNAVGGFVIERNASTFQVKSAGYQFSGNIANGSNAGSAQSTFQALAISVNATSKIYSNVGAYTGLILYNNSNIYGTGDNSTGRLGINNITTQFAFTLMNTAFNIDTNFIDGSSTVTAFIDTSGNLMYAGTTPSNSTSTRIFTQFALPK